MKLNQNKCHLAILGYKYDSIWARFEDEVIFEWKNQKLLGVIIDNTLSFDGYVIALHKKAWTKLITLDKLVKCFSCRAEKDFNENLYWIRFANFPLVCIFWSRRANNKTNHIHKIALRMVYKNYDLPFSDLHRKHNSYSAHHRNIQLMAIKLCKFKNNLSFQIWYDVTYTELRTLELIG